MRLIVLVQIDTVPAGRECQVKLDAAETRVVEVEVVGLNRVTEVGLAMTLVNERSVGGLAVRIASEQLETLGPCLNRLRWVLSAGLG
jgi:hypothetical protein